MSLERIISGSNIQPLLDITVNDVVANDLIINDLEVENLEIQGTTNAESSSTGSLVCDGGVGIAKNLILSSTSSMSIGSNLPANASTILDCVSSTKVFRPPRMTTLQRTAISNANGGIVFDTDLNQHFSFLLGGWKAIKYTPLYSYFVYSLSAEQWLTASSSYVDIDASLNAINFTAISESVKVTINFLGKVPIGGDYGSLAVTNQLNAVQGFEMIAMYGANAGSACFCTTYVSGLTPNSAYSWKLRYKCVGGGGEFVIGYGLGSGMPFSIQVESV
jgi:hypothetical protein